MRGARLRYFTAGESVALAPTVEAAHENLMRSPGQRESVLREQFEWIGLACSAPAGTASGSPKRFATESRHRLRSVTSVGMSNGS